MRLQQSDLDKSSDFQLDFRFCRELRTLSSITYMGSILRRDLLKVSSKQNLFQYASGHL